MRVVAGGPFSAAPERPTVILLAVYALIVWYLALRYRRRWQGFLAVILGVLAIRMLAGLFEVHDASSHAGGGARGSHQILTLLWAEMGIVAAVGLYVACLPRGRRELDCFGCGYDLTGLDPQGLDCPECGRRWTGKGSGLADDPPPEVFTPIPTRRVKKRAGM